MGLDSRIGSKFLKAGIGYGGSCFPKDTKALVQIAGDVEHKFDLLEAVINVNNKQQVRLVELALERFISLRGKKVAMLGLAFKPNTDDMREAASIVMAERLMKEGAVVVAYDPIAIENAKKFIGDKITYVETIESALDQADAVFIVTEWDQIKNLPLDTFAKLMKEPVVFDGRNCYKLEEVKKHYIEYYSIGRPSIKEGVWPLLK